LAPLAGLASALCHTHWGYSGFQLTGRCKWGHKKKNKNKSLGLEVKPPKIWSLTSTHSEAAWSKCFSVVDKVAGVVGSRGRRLLFLLGGGGSRGLHPLENCEISAPNGCFWCILGVNSAPIR